MADERKDQPVAESADRDEQGSGILPWAEKWLSTERFVPYLKACDGDVGKALDLYRWNVSLGQFLMRDISYFEVALRNSYNSVMESRWDGEAHWLLDDGSPVRKPVVRKSGKGESDVNRVNRIIIDKTVNGLPKGFSTGALVAGLTLGFWVHLTDRAREAVIWRTGLYAAWPKGTNRGELQDRLDGILRVRNRIAHNERLFDPRNAQLSPKRVNADAVRLLGQLQPEAAGYLLGAGDATLDEFLEKHPAPVGVEL